MRLVKRGGGQVQKSVLYPSREGHLSTVFLRDFLFWYRELLALNVNCDDIFVYVKSKGKQIYGRVPRRNRLISGRAQENIERLFGVTGDEGSLSLFDVSENSRVALIARSSILLGANSKFMKLVKPLARSSHRH